MKLTEQNIQNLYKFTRQHYVYHYDVQTELVDHLANDIEQIWEENPTLSFEKARDTSFKKFGVFGFMNVVEVKQSQMTKKYFKLTLRFAKEWFKLPKIIVTILLFLGFYQLQKIAYSYTIYNIIFFSIILIQLLVVFLNSRKLKKKHKITGRKWMFEDVILNEGIVITLLLSLMFFDVPANNSEEFLMMGNFRSLFSAFLMTTLCIFSYITLVVIPKKATELLEETYPEYKIS